jgi:hypothetical protein
MLGDSQSLVFNNLLFEAEHQQQQYSLLTLARYCPGLAAHTFSNDQGRLHETIVRALLSDCLIDKENRALYQFQSPQAGILSLLAGRVASAPVLVFFCGSGDLVNIFLRHLGDRNDFFLPDQDSLLIACEDPGPRQVFPYQTARAYILDLMIPLFRGLAQLKQMGFDQLYLHDLVPQTPDDHDFEQVYGYRCPIKIRTKALLLFNQLLREQAAAHSIGLISIWEQVTAQNLRVDTFSLDSIHLNKQAAFLTVDTLWQQMTQALPAVYVTKTDQIQAKLETLQELSLQLAHEALQGKYPQVLALWEDNSQLWHWLEARQSSLFPQLKLLVTALQAMNKACTELNQTEKAESILLRFKPSLDYFARLT